MGKQPDERPPKANIVDQVQGDGFRLLLLVSADQMSASVQIVRSTAKATCPADKVVDLVRRSKLRLSHDEDARLPELAQRIAGDVDSVMVAQGRLAEKWKDVDWFIPIGISLLRDYSNETVDLHEVSHFINVRAGQALCELSALPKVGSDVFGLPLAAPPCPVQLGDRVAVDPKNPLRVLATQAGCVRYANGRLSVEQDLVIAGDLDFKVGNIEFFGDVTIRGNILDGFRVKSEKNIVIGGAVGVATIEAGGNLTIKGGVNGGHKGKLVCAGNLQAHYLHMVSAECGGDVLVDVECHDSTVVASGSVTVTRGGIIGGKIIAGSDISAGFLGAEMCVPTLLHAGYQANVDQQLEKPRKALAQAVNLVKNLESALGQCGEQPGTSIRFPAQRKTQMIQLQSRLADARLVAQRAHAALLAQMHSAAPVGATIASARQVFPRVTLVIDSVCEEEVATELPGPVRLTLDREQLTIKTVSGKRASAK
jgi:uncharacterized protein (DUF342 family)